MSSKSFGEQGNSRAGNGGERTPERVNAMHTHLIIVLSQLVSLLG